MEPRSSWGIAPYFLVDDVASTAAYYRDRLGFAYDRLWGEPPSFCMVRRQGVTIMLRQASSHGLMRPNHLVEEEAWDAYLWIGDADALHAEFAAEGVTIARGICDQDYGCRDFELVDCNGYRLCFGQPL